MLWHLNASSLSVLAALSSLASVLKLCLIDLVVDALTMLLDSLDRLGSNPVGGVYSRCVIVSS
jgi:hypothetical protein